MTNPIIDPDNSLDKLMAREDIDLLLAIVKDRSDLRVEGKVSDGALCIMLNVPDSEVDGKPVFFGVKNTDLWWNVSQDIRFMGA